MGLDVSLDQSWLIVPFFGTLVTASSIIPNLIRVSPGSISLCNRFYSTQHNRARTALNLSQICLSKMCGWTQRTYELN